jgi:hypothetical protein
VGGIHATSKSYASIFPRPSRPDRDSKRPGLVVDWVVVAAPPQLEELIKEELRQPIEQLVR